VYKALKNRPSIDFHIVFSASRTLPDVVDLACQELGSGAVALTGERVFDLGLDRHGLSNKGFRFAFQKGLLSTISRLKPDVLIVEGFGQWTPYAVLYASFKRVPVVVSYERTAHTERNAGFVRTFYRKVLSRFVHGMVCNGIQSKEYCTKVLGIRDDRVFTHGMAYDSRFLVSLSQDQAGTQSGVDLRSKFNLQGLVFLYVGRMVRTKGISQLLEAWKIFSDHHKDDVTLVMVGGGPAFADLEETIKLNKIENVKLPGEVKHQHLPAFYKAADIFVMPTLEDNWSLVVMEAMASELPILCSKYNGCWPELVHAGANGWVFDPLDKTLFVSALEDSWANRHRFEKMGQESVRIVKNYSPGHSASSVLSASGLENANL